jgi:IclR family acetate operon transcriptional repressor
MTRTARTASGAGGIKSVAKVLDILEYLADAGRPVGASEVARAVGFHVSTTHRLLRTLAARGYVDQHSARRSFVLGPQLRALGTAYNGGGLVQVARPEIEALRDTLGETIHLSIYREGEVIEVAAAGGLQPVSVSLGAGRRDPANCTALGKVLLAELDADALADFFARGPLERRTPHSITRKADFLRALKEVRRQGYGTDEEEFAAEICCIAVPVRDPAQNVVAALSIAMPKSRYRGDRVKGWVKALAAAAARIGGRLSPGRI